MGLGNAAVGVGATLLSKFISLKTWTLINLDTQEVLQGQFPPDETNAEYGANWAAITTLNRQSPILQYLNGASDTVQVSARFYRRDILDDSPIDKFNVLKEWTRMDEKLRRPPILSFSLGTGDLSLDQCVLERISNVRYSVPTGGGAVGALVGAIAPDLMGGVREIQFSLQFRRMVKFSLDEQGVTDTRYARARERDYYESLAREEYGDALLGDVIRKRHPRQLLLDTGNIVKLPAIEGIRTTRVQQTSIPLKTAFGRKDTEQRRLRIQYFARRSKPALSYLFSKSGAVSPFNPLQIPSLAFWMPPGGVTLNSPPVSRWTDASGQWLFTQSNPNAQPVWDEVNGRVVFTTL